MLITAQSLFPFTILLRVVLSEMQCRRLFQGSSLWPGGEPDEAGLIQDWWKDAKKEWEKLFDGDEDFHMWDEFDLGINPELLEQVKKMDASTLNCTGADGPFSVWYDLAYDDKSRLPSMMDWDEKMFKKAIVAGMQPPDEKDAWYVPLVYQAFYPFHTQDKLTEIVNVVKTWFKEHPEGEILFLKGSLGGGSGTSIKWCDPKAAGTKQPMYRLKNHPELEESVMTCVKEITEFITGYKKRALEEWAKKNRWAAPPGTFGYPGFVIEPGYKFNVEIKSHLVWGKLLSTGTQTPFDCLHISNGHDGKFIRFRGKEDDPRLTPEEKDGKPMTIGEVVKETKCGESMLSDEMLKKAKDIAEGIAKHAPMIRVDIFINTETGAMVVNEIEGFYHVCGYRYDTHEEIMHKMARLWVEGWQKLEKSNRLKRIKRVVGRYQDVAPMVGVDASFWDIGHASPAVPTGPSPTPKNMPCEQNSGPGAFYMFAWILSLLVVGGAVYFFAGNSARSIRGPDNEGVEMRA